MVMSRNQNAGQNHNIKLDNKYFDRVEQFKYLRTTLTNQNSIQEEIKSRLKSRNACYHSVQDLLSSSLLSKNTKIKIYRTIILPVVLYGWETWSLTLREEHRLRVFENRVLRRIFGPKRGRAMAQRLVAGLPPRRPGFDHGPVYVGFVVEKVALGQVFPPEYFGFPLSISFHRCSITWKSEKKKLIIFLFIFTTRVAQ
jgi:hypothetical protein